MLKNEERFKQLKVGQIIESGGCRWLIKDGVSDKGVMSALAHARLSGSVGAKDVTVYEDGTEIITGWVHKVNSDNSEVQPYTEVY